KQCRGAQHGRPGGEREGNREEGKRVSGCVVRRREWGDRKRVQAEDGGTPCREHSCSQLPSLLCPQCTVRVALFFRVGERKVADEKDRRPKVLFLFEAKYHASGSPTQDTAVDFSREALHALNGVRVCFVHCSTAIRQNVNAAVSTVPSVDVKSCALDGAVVRQQHPFLMGMRFAAEEDDPSQSLSDMMCKLLGRLVAPRPSTPCRRRRSGAISWIASTS
ncbi:Hypothetical protein, putative, partial [Bodo saltans]